MSNINGDLLDDGLQAVMGKDRCQNNWQPSKKAEAKNERPSDKKETKKEKPAEAQWEPVKPAPDWMDKLIGCVKDTFLFAGLSILFFYWQQTGQMLPSAAMPAICTCMVLAGIGIGKNFAGGVR